MILYRYLSGENQKYEGEYLDEFFEHGRLQISSLYRFREVENEKRRDFSEGEKEYVGKLNATDPLESINIPIHLTDSNGKQVLDATYWKRITLANCFSLSFTFKQDETYSSKECFRINDPDAFEDIIAKEIEKKYPLGASIHGPCFYHEKEQVLGVSGVDHRSIDYKLLQQIHHDPILSAFLKEKIFEEESEYRMLWIPFYDGKASVKTLQRIRKYGYKFIEDIHYWPHNLTSFPEKQEMIPKTLFIENKDLIRFAERC
jgi:hypothetical protein